MEITIKCNSLKELKEAIDQLYVLLPEKNKREHKDDETGGGVVTGEKKKRYDPELHDQIVTLRKQGMSAKEIAQQVGKTEVTVYAHLRKEKEGGAK